MIAMSVAISVQWFKAPSSVSFAVIGMGKRPRDSSASGSNVRAKLEAGPLQDVVAKLPQNVAKMLATGGPQVQRNLEAFHNTGIAVTSSYSGLGTFEVAAKALFRTVAKERDLVPKQAVTCYSACDNSREAQTAIQAHKPETRPRHLFIDLLDRVPGPDLRRLRAEEEKYLTLWQDTKNEFVSGNISGEAKMDWHRRLTSQYIFELHSIFGTVEFLPDAPCLIHGCRCPVSPRAEEPNTLWFEAAGSTCTAFSKMGSQDQWLHPPALVFFAWLYAMRYYEPDGIFHECVGNFPSHIFSDILNSQAEQLKCVYSVDMPKQPGSTDEDNKDEWGIETLLFSPVDLGIPVNRIRRYTYIYKKASFDIMQPLRFHELFAESLKHGAELTLRVNDVCHNTGRQHLTR